MEIRGGVSPLPPPPPGRVRFAEMTGGEPSPLDPYLERQHNGLLAQLELHAKLHTQLLIQRSTQAALSLRMSHSQGRPALHPLAPRPLPAGVPIAPYMKSAQAFNVGFPPFLSMMMPLLVLPKLLALDDLAR